MGVRGFLWASAFCFSVVGVAAPSARLVRLNYFKSIGDFPETWQVLTIRSSAFSDKLVISTNLSYSFPGNPELSLAYESKLKKIFPQIPDGYKSDFLKKIFEEWEKGEVKHLVFDNVPWKQVKASFVEKISCEPFSQKLIGLKSLEFFNTVVGIRSLAKFCKGSNIERLSFVSCFMKHNFLDEMRVFLPHLKELSISDVGFLKNPLGGRFAKADDLPNGLRKLSIHACYGVSVASNSEIDGVSIPQIDGMLFYIPKLCLPLGLDWFIEQEKPFPYLELFNFSTPEIDLEQLASFPIDEIFEKMPRLNLFRLFVPIYGGSYVFDDKQVDNKNKRKRIDFLDFNKKFKVEAYPFLDSLVEITWTKSPEKSLNLLTFETDDAFSFEDDKVIDDDDDVISTLSLSKDQLFFERNERVLRESQRERAKKNFKSLIGKFPDVCSVALSKEDSFSPELSSFLKENGVKNVKISVKSEDFPENTYLEAAQRTKLAFDFFENNEKQSHDSYLSELLCKNLVSTGKLLKKDIERSIENGSINSVFKKELLNLESLTQDLLKDSGIFLFTVSELESARVSLGSYPACSLEDPCALFFRDNSVTHFGIPLEFLELFSSDFNKKPGIDIEVLKNYLSSCQETALFKDGIKKENIKEMLTKSFLYRMTVEALFPSPCQLIPLLKVQKRAELIARKILGEEGEGSGGSSTASTEMD